MAMLPEVKARLREAGIRKRQTNRLLKDLDPFALMVFARDEFDDKVGDAGTQWAYLSRASYPQISALKSAIPSHEVLVGSRVGLRMVTVFESKRINYALRKLGVNDGKVQSYVKVLHKRWKPPTT